MGLVQKEIEKEAAEKKPAAGYVDKERKGMPGLMDNEGQDQGSEGLKAAGQGTGCGRGDVLGRVMDAYRAARFQSLPTRRTRTNGYLQCQSYGRGDCGSPAASGPEDCRGQGEVRMKLPIRS